MKCALTRQYCERKCAVGKCFLIKQGLADARRVVEGTERRKRAGDFDVIHANNDFSVSANNYYKDVDL